MPKKRWIPTYDITVKISVPMASDPRPAWNAAHGAVKNLRAALPPGAGCQIMHTAPGKMEAVATNGPQTDLSLNSVATTDPHAEQRKEISPQANDGNGLAPETATEEISRPPVTGIAEEALMNSGASYDEAMELPSHMDRRVPRREAE